MPGIRERIIHKDIVKLRSLLTAGMDKEAALREVAGANKPMGTVKLDKLRENAAVKAVLAGKVPRAEGPEAEEPEAKPKKGKGKKAEAEQL